ncbi:endopeptidase La [Pelagibaculum spongiae]|uniref:Lon protease n=1 Tax=Pelagibaculum spongiae TaxID=2080658 RepID=A0A2V1GU09_9GAMM|nr:endopeptidase La [Pelagibaculum spongiae]PVZ69499.1 endopeptidase La [Pelagibaculum spongiae]
MSNLSNDDDVVIEKEETGLILPNQALPTRVYLIPSHNRPYFPAQVQPLVISRDHWEETVERVSDSDHQVLGLCFASSNGEDEPVNPEDFRDIGCAVKLHNVHEDGDKLLFIAQGMQRFKIKRWISKKAPYLVEVEYPKEPVEDNDQLKAYALALIKLIKELLPLNPLYNEELKHYLNRFSPNDPSPLADFAAAITTAKGEDLQQVLETLPLIKRMEKVLLLLRKELEVAQLQHKISEEVNNKINDRQREFFLREQLKIIQRELGISKDDRSSDVDEFEERMAKLKPTEQVAKRFKEELHKLSMLETGSPEYAVTRNYLDWITNVPWGVVSKDSFDLKSARQVLDKEHTGLDDVKDRIIEFLAVGALKGEISGSIMLLVGPPGVGKTSIGKSVAETLGRKFYRFSLGGMRDEAEIKGHRRTYIGAMPGKLIQALKEVETANPVIMLDEIDKVGASYQGDPASALLEVLDPEQNGEFLDHYLDLRVDLSKALFICTANQLDTIPRPLLDRMETIRLSGYLASEKQAIAKKHLWPKLLKKTGLKKSQIALTDTALKQLVEGYAREAGVRHLEKLLHKIQRKAVVKVLENPKQKVSVSGRQLEDYLGKPYFTPDKRLAGIGIVTGLAWTSMGGATLAIEAARVHQRLAGIKLTGKLGDVMKESAEIAYSFVSSRTENFNIDQKWFDKSFVHLHVPEGATPKDGPSAGVTMTTALISLATGRKPKPGIAMTGELTLTGLVFPVGGIKEKVIAAKRVKIFELILPDANRGDFEELPEYIKEGMTVHFAEKYQDVADVVFG